MQDGQAARRRLGVPLEAMCVLVFGGSLGARSINLAAVQALGGAPMHVLHICGERDYRELSAQVLPAGYDLREYLDRDQFADALAAADLVVARSGGSVFEIAAQGLPSILIPYPSAAGDHQSSNARWMADAGAAIVIADGELTGPRAGIGGRLAAGRPGPPPGDGPGGPDPRPPRRRAGRRRCGAEGRGRMSAADRPWSGRRLHFVGVGGAGMSGYARAASALGASVSGSDGSNSGVSGAARRRGHPRPPRSGTRRRTSRRGRGSS